MALIIRNSGSMILSSSTLSPRRPPSPPLSLRSPPFADVGNDEQISRRRNGGSRILRAPPIRVSSENSTRVTSPSSSSSSSSVLGFEENRESSSNLAQSASDVVRAFYAGVNCHDLASVEELFAENCVYEDLIFPRPFTGRKAILSFFQTFNDSISKDLQFVIDDMSEEDSSGIGVTWHLGMLRIDLVPVSFYYFPLEKKGKEKKEHLTTEMMAEWQGKTFPFSKGCSFYRLEFSNGRRQIVYGRDSVEPFMKPGESALAAIKGVTWLLEKFPQLANWL